MNDLVLSAYQVLKALSEREALSEYRKVGVSYADVWPGQLVFSVSLSDGEVKNCLIPVWQIRISKKAWEKALGTEKESETLYLTLNGNKVFCPSEGVFKQAEAGTVFGMPMGVPTCCRSVIPCIERCLCRNRNMPSV